jgi:hypothetical protein
MARIKKERKGKERKGKERKGKGRKGKERKGTDTIKTHKSVILHTHVGQSRMVRS